MEPEKITLTGAPETMLATLYGKALDSRSPRSILRDHQAERAVRRIDYDFRRSGDDPHDGSRRRAAREAAR
jgi:O-methyltransferase involved in polyketide biosynthesis